MQNLPKSLLELLDRCPPFLAYYCAHFDKPKRPALPAMAKLSGLSYRTFTRTAHLLSWSHVRVEVIDRFGIGCGVDILNPEPLYEFWVKQQQSTDPFNYLRGAQRRVDDMKAVFNKLAARAVMSKQ